MFLRWICFLQRKPAVQIRERIYKNENKKKSHTSRHSKHEDDVTRVRYCYTRGSPVASHHHVCFFITNLIHEYVGCLLLAFLADNDTVPTLRQLNTQAKTGPNTLGSKYSGAMHWHWTHVSLCCLHSHSQLPELSVEGRPTSLEWIMFMDRIFYSSASFFSWLYSLRPSSSATPGLFLTHSVIFITTATATINCRTSWK